MVSLKVTVACKADKNLFTIREMSIVRSIVMSHSKKPDFTNVRKVKQSDLKALRRNVISRLKKALKKIKPGK